MLQGIVLSRLLMGQCLISIDLQKPQLSLTAADAHGTAIPGALPAAIETLQDAMELLTQHVQRQNTERMRDASMLAVAMTAGVEEASSGPSMSDASGSLLEMQGLGSNQPQTSQQVPAASRKHCLSISWTLFPDDTRQLHCKTCKSQSSGYRKGITVSCSCRLPNDSWSFDADLLVV